ncbi:hypothetical protein RIR_jg33902.t1 [Rhizophagus irregularis DAOM 181602=DAOM 197198]|nr:hypothetical protein RIR_jg33902.t1 [Rhizophagus irregularis DAOM 181602=DAOM 197198]
MTVQYAAFYGGTAGIAADVAAGTAGTAGVAAVAPDCDRCVVGLVVFSAWASQYLSAPSIPDSVISPYRAAIPSSVIYIPKPIN